MAGYNMTINLAAVVGQLQRSLQHSFDRVSLGLLAADKMTSEELTLQGSWQQLSLTGKELRTADTIKEDFNNWILANGFRDCTEAIGAYLEEVRNVCTVLSFSGKMTGEDWNDNIVQGAKKFHRLGLPDKINDLKDQHDPVLVTGYVDDILSINTARNCLVHRNGIVSGRDVNSPDGMLVQWRKMEIVVEGRAGRRAVVPPASLEKGELVTMQLVNTNKIFKLGEMVVFSAQEFSDVCLTLFFWGKNLVSLVEDYARKKGVPFNT